MSECVKVIVRCRPLNDKEDTDVVVTVDPPHRQVTLTQKAVNVTCPRKVFTFDCVYGTGATNEEIYNEVVSPLVDSILLGYNGCVFAYGQTSCGKTFSMQGFPDPPSQLGVMSRTFEHIFEYIQTTDVTYYAVRVSYLEIYNEEIRDLLHRQNGRKLDVKEHPEKGVYVKDLTTVDVTCVEDMEEVLEIGSWNRVLGATAQNPDSSRSHCIFTVEFELCFRMDFDEQEQFRSGRLNLVDLAGSERQRYSRAEGERFKEATKINLSLSALGNVISALVKENTKHIPYRASKLTRLLQDSLGGNSRTLMIACVCPGENNYGETLSTLRYANRAKNIKNRPRMNEDPKDKLIRQYQEDIKILQQLLANHVGLTEPPSTPVPPTAVPACTSPTKESAAKGDSLSVHELFLSKKERLAYEQTINNLKEKFDDEHISRERLNNTLKSTQSDYNNYRLKHEYKMQKMKSEFKMKIIRLRELAHSNTTKDNDSDESGYTSLNSREFSEMSFEGMSDNARQDKNGTLSPMSDNSHLWSYQWLRCYCDSSKKCQRSQHNMENDVGHDGECHCCCIDDMKQHRQHQQLQNKAEKELQMPCQCCSNAHDSKGLKHTIKHTITAQPDWLAISSKERMSGDRNDEENDMEHPRVCCIKAIRFFG